MSQLAIVWFRNDLRIADNPALYEAAKSTTVLPIYIFDDVNSGIHQPGAASKVWIHHSLMSLNRSLMNLDRSGNADQRNADQRMGLGVYSGNAHDILHTLCEQLPISSVYWNRCYEPWSMQRDSQIKSTLTQQGVQVHSFNASLLWEPQTIQKQDQTPFKVFTPFYRKGCLMANPPRPPMATINELKLAQIPMDASRADADELATINLLPKIDWYQKLFQTWDISERGAHKQLQTFLVQGIHDYKLGRNYPARANVSMLSPYIQTGEISVQQIWQAISQLEPNSNTDHFCSELGWREFSYNLLFHNHHLSTTNLQSKFDHFPWKNQESLLLAWKKGLTGYPLVDAGMRQLWQTGYIHNRVRMVVGSFLVKNLLIDWRYGERHFWDCLVDADTANNSASWQWIAGCGADAAPYFRIFNPITQAQKFDPDGQYIRTYVPELQNLNSPDIFTPWQLNDGKLMSAGIRLGVDYPLPIVDVAASRQRALDAFASLKETPH